MYTHTHTLSLCIVAAFLSQERCVVIHTVLTCQLVMVFSAMPTFVTVEMWDGM